MRRLPWASDAKQIMEAVRALIDGHLPVLLQRQRGRPLQSQLLAIHTHRQIPYLLMARPPDLASAYEIRDLLFKLTGMPILGFSCPVTRASDTLLATMLPLALFSLDVRETARTTSLPGSMATFFVQGRSQVNICTMENISISGVKLSGQPSHSIARNDMIGPCTLSLAGQDAVISREVTINKAAVVRVEPKGGAQNFGLKLDLNESEELQLREHLNFLNQVKVK
jgi:hypothetical protein